MCNQCKTLIYRNIFFNKICLYINRSSLSVIYSKVNYSLISINMKTCAILIFVAVFVISCVQVSYIFWIFALFTWNILYIDKIRTYFFNINVSFIVIIIAVLNSVNKAPRLPRALQVLVDHVDHHPPISVVTLYHLHLVPLTAQEIPYLYEQTVLETYYHHRNVPVS